MARVVRVLVCRPTSSADLEIIGSCFIESSSSSSEISFEPPSEHELVRLGRQRIKWHFSNSGKIELDRYLMFYNVRVEKPFTLVHICATEASKSTDEAQNFLNQLGEVILSDPQLLMLLPNAGELELQTQLEPKISQLMMAENTSSNAAQQQKMDSLRQQVDSVKTVMANNVEAIMARGERLENIERRTDDLQAHSESFKLTARRVQRRMCLQNAKWTAISVVAVLVVLTIIILIILGACGVFDKK